MQADRGYIALGALAFGCIAALVGCDRGQTRKAPPSAQSTTPAENKAEAPAARLKVGKGVDLATKTVKIGALNDESGPAATIGKPYAVGKRVLAAQVNAGDSGLLPPGWKVELIEKDHGYNPQKAVQAYNQIKDEILFIATSFGTPNTLPLRPMLERDEMLTLPASLSSEMAHHKYTIPLGPSYEMEAMRAMDWVVAQAEEAGRPKKRIRAAIVYQKDDYGEDGLSGWRAAAKHHGVEIITEQTVTPGQREFADLVRSLKKARATHVLLTVLPSASGPLLATATQLRYKPTWIGQTPTWIDNFFDPEVVPPNVFKNFHWVTGVTYWREDVPGMESFLAAYEEYGAKQSDPDFYLLLSYTHGLYGLEVVKRAIEAGDVTREGLMTAAQKVEGFTANGLIQPISTSKFPYVTSTVTRVLKPVFDEKSWELIAPYASPATLEESATTAQTAPADPGGSTPGSVVHN